jgi:hypothetical protein
MHIDVDLAGIERDEQRDDRLAVARQIIGIGGAHRAEHELVAHRTAVDEQILAERIGAAERRQRRKAFDHEPVDAAAPAADLDRIGAELRAEHVGKAREPPDRARHRRGPGQRHAILAREGESNVGTAHGETSHDVAQCLAFGAIGFEKFQSRRGGIEQVAHLDPGALAERRGLGLRLLAAFDRDRPGVRLGRMAGDNRQARDRADRGQRLAAETERADREQIIAVELRSGMPLDREHEILAAHALAVVANADEPATARFGDDFDAAGAGVERVLDELLDDARGTLDHFAGGDAVDDGFIELANGHGAPI